MATKSCMHTYPGGGVPIRLQYYVYTASFMIAIEAENTDFSWRTTPSLFPSEIAHCTCQLSTRYSTSFWKASQARSKREPFTLRIGFVLGPCYSPLSARPLRGLWGLVVSQGVHLAPAHRTGRTRPLCARVARFLNTCSSSKPPLLTPINLLRSGVLRSSRTTLWVEALTVCICRRFVTFALHCTRSYVVVKTSKVPTNVYASSLVLCVVYSGGLPFSHQSFMTHSHNNCDSSPSPAASYNGGCGMSASSSPPMLELPPRRSPPFLPLPPPAALLLTPKLTLPQLTMPQPQRTNSRFSPPLAIGVGQQQQLPPLPHLDTSVLARMQPPPPPAVIAAAVLARAASLATKKFGPLQPQTSPRLPQLVSPHMMPQSTSPAYQSSFSGGHTSSSPPAPAALALPPPRVHDDGGAKSADNGSSYTGPDCGDSGGPSFTLPASSSCRGSMTPPSPSPLPAPTKVNNALVSKRKPSPEPELEPAEKRSAVKSKEDKTPRSRYCREKRSCEPPKRSSLSSDAKRKDRFSNSKNRSTRSPPSSSHRHYSRGGVRSPKRRSRDRCRSRSRSRSSRVRRRGCSHSRSRDRGRGRDGDFSRGRGGRFRGRDRDRDREAVNRKPRDRDRDRERTRERSPHTDDDRRRHRRRHSPDNAYNDRRQPPSSRRWANDTHRAHTSRWDDRAPRHQQQPQQQPTPGGPRRSSRWENRGGGNEGAAAFGSGPSRSSRFSPVAAAQDPRIGGGREHYPSGGNSSSSSPPLLHCLRAGRDQRPPPSLPHYHHPQAYSGDDSGGGFRRRHDGDMRDFDESEPPRKRHRVGFAARFDDGYRTRETGFRPYHHPPQPNTFAGDRYHSRGGGGGGSQWHDDQEWYSPSDYRPSHHGGHQRPPSSKSHHGGRHHPATSSYHYPARHRRRSHRFSSGGGKHRSVTSSSSSSKSGAATRKDAPGTAACHSLSVVRVVTEGSMFPIEANQRLASEAPNQASRSHNDNSGDRLKTSATIIKVEPSPSPAPERTPLILSPMSIASSSDDIDALSMSDFSCDETVIMSDDESEHEDSDSESSVVKPFVSNTQSLPIAAADSDDEGALPPPPPPLFIVTTSLDDEDDAEDDESSSNESSSSSSWEGEFGDDPALPFYAAPTFAELCGCGGKGDDDPTDGWIVGLSRNELDERLRARRLVSSYSELQNPEVVRSHIRPLTHDLRNLLATLSHAKSASVLHKDDEAFVSSFRNHLGDSARMMQRGLPYIGSLYA